MHGNSLSASLIPCETVHLCKINCLGHSNDKRMGVMQHVLLEVGELWMLSTQCPWNIERHIMFYYFTVRCSTGVCTMASENGLGLEVIRLIHVTRPSNWGLAGSGFFSMRRDTTRHDTIWYDRLWLQITRGNGGASRGSADGGGAAVCHCCHRVPRMEPSAP